MAENVIYIGNLARKDAMAASSDAYVMSRHHAPANKKDSTGSSDAAAPGPAMGSPLPPEF